MMREHFELSRGQKGNFTPISHHLEEYEHDLEEETNNILDDGALKEPINLKNGENGLQNQTKKIFWPRAINQKFMDEAFNTRFHIGLVGYHKECMAFLCGYEDQDGIHPTHLVFPAQKSDRHEVEDLGIDGQDTLLYMANIFSLDKPKHKYKLISWIHSHVGGTRVGFSSVDIHMHHGLDKHVSPGILGTVFEVTHCRYEYQYDHYILTDEGHTRVGECIATGHVMNRQHSECSDDKFYKSAKENVTLTDDEIIVIDGRGSKPLHSEQLEGFTEPIREIAGSNQCRACKRQFPDDSSLLYHVGRAKKCKPSYEDEIVSFRDFIKKRKNAAYYKQKKSHDKPGQTERKEDVPEDKDAADYVCPICEKKFEWKKSKDRHVREVHSSSAEDKFKCQDCTKSFSRKEHLRDHQDQEHVGETVTKYKCEVCEELFTQTQHLSRHIREVHSSSIGDRIKCPDCESTFSRKENMNEHWNRSHAETPDRYFCVECDEMFTKRTHAIRHFNEIHLGEQYICQECPAVFSRKDRWTAHKAEDKHWQYHFCWDCNKVLTFKEKEDIKSHFDSHQREKHYSTKWGVYCQHKPGLKECGCCNKWYNRHYYFSSCKDSY